MNNFRLIFCFAACFILMTEIVIATSPYDSDSGEYDIDSYMDQLLQASRPEKRGWCRPGFTMNPVLNRCVPTMRALIQGRNYNRFRRFGK
ncbi:O2 contryphan Vc1-like [Crassostrea virginica]